MIKLILFTSMALVGSLAQAGNKIPASLSISHGATFNFGTVATGASVDTTLVVTNGGGAPATMIAGRGLEAPFTFKGGTFPGTGGTCGGTLNAASTCTVVVNYSPTRTGTANATMTLAYGDKDAAQSATRALTGIGVSPSSLSIRDTDPYDFGAVANGKHAFTLTNSGGFPASAMNGHIDQGTAFAFAGGSYPGIGGTCTTTLNASGSCTIVVAYAPGKEASTANVVVDYYNGAATSTVSRGLTGSASAPARAKLEIEGPDSYNYYSYGTLATGGVADHTFTLKNSGDGPAANLRDEHSGAGFSYKGGGYPGTGGTCGQTLNAGGMCTLVITYAPTYSGTQFGHFNLRYDEDALVSWAVQGTGVMPASLVVSHSPSYDFGSVSTGGSRDGTFTLTNGGSMAASAMSGTGLSAPYSYKGGSYPGAGGTCSSALAASATCTVVVTFAPTATGASSATLSVSYFDGANNRTATRSLQAVGSSPANLTVSDGATYNFGNVATGDAFDKVFTITNSGGSDATLLTGSGLEAPFSYKGGSFPGTGGTCGATLAPSATCSVVATFNPSAQGTFTGTLNLAYNNGVSTTTSTRSVTGADGKASGEPAKTHPRGPSKDRVAEGGEAKRKAKVKHVARSQNHACALFDSGRVTCWGSNAFGQLGLGDSEDRLGQGGKATDFVDLGQDRTATAIATGLFHSCALLDDGAVKCWGSNAFGQLGTYDVYTLGDQPDQMGEALPALDFQTEAKAIALSLGDYHSCVVFDDATTKCVGYVGGR